MLAVFGSLEEIQAVLSAQRIDVVIANKNAPRQYVLSGATGEIERAAASLLARKAAVVPIPVSAAFHSPLVAGAEGPLREVLESIWFSPSAVPVFANTTAAPYPADPAGARALLAGQLARPVEFVRQIESMYAMGARTFLEVGPDSKLTALVPRYPGGAGIPRHCRGCVPRRIRQSARSGLLARVLGRTGVCCRSCSMGRRRSRPGPRREKDGVDCQDLRRQCAAEGCPRR